MREVDPGFKASYTIEASWIFGISIIVIFAAIMTSVMLYGNTCEYIDNVSVDRINAVGTFRLLEEGIQTGRDLKLTGMND